MGWMGRSQNRLDRFFPNINGQKKVDEPQGNGYRKTVDKFGQGQDFSAVPAIESQDKPK